MKKSKSRLVILIVIISIIVITIIIGAILFLKTDIFKSKQELFYKYAFKNSEILEMLNNKSDNTEALKNSKYTTQGEVTFDLISSETEIANQAIPPRNFKINYKAKTDETLNRTSSEATLKYLSKDLFTLKYMKNDDVYALKSDEVINKYIAIENNNLKEFAKKYGIENTDSIPNKIQGINIEELLYMNQEEKNTIIEKYMKIINSQISKTSYSKQKNVEIENNDEKIKTNSYSLELTMEQLNNIKKAILENLTQDENTLNILISKIKIINSESDINIEKLKVLIQEEINKISQEDNNKGNIKLVVYENGSELVRTEYIDQNGKIIIDFTKAGNAKKILITNEYDIATSNKEVIKENNEINKDVNTIQNIDNNQTANINNTTDNNVENILDEKVKLKTIELANQKMNGETQQVIVFKFELKNGEIIKVATQSKMNSDLANGIIDNNIVININISDKTYFTTKISQKTTISNDVVVEELNDTNSAKANNFTKEYTTQLSTAIINRINQLYKEKNQLVTIVQQEEAEQQTNNQVQQNENINTNNIENNNINSNNINSVNTTNNNIANNNI